MKPIINIKRAYDEPQKDDDAVEPFREAHREMKVVTLIYAAKDEQHNHAIVLRAYLEH